MKEHTLAATAIHLETNSPLLSIRVVIMPNLHDSIKLTRSSTLVLRSGSLLFVALYGSAGFEPVSVLLNDIAEVVLESLRGVSGMVWKRLEESEVSLKQLVAASLDDDAKGRDAMKVYGSLDRRAAVYIEMDFSKCRRRKVGNGGEVLT